MLGKLISRKEKLPHTDRKEIEDVKTRLSDVETRVQALTLQVKLMQREI